VRGVASGPAPSDHACVTGTVEPRVFVCYSRSDVDFATHAVAVLGQLGIACWLDVDRLAPGEEWARATESALDGSAALLLIASRESLASPYCRREWETATRADKPIVLAAIEVLADLGDLATAAVIDMRSPGPEPWHELADALPSGRGPRHSSVVRFRIPRPMQIAALALLVLFAFQLVAFADTLEHTRTTLTDPSPGVTALVVAHVMILVGWITYTVRWSRRFLHRDATMLGLFGMVASPALWVFHGIFSVASSALVAIPLLVMGLMYGILHLALGGLELWVPARRRTSRQARPTMATAPAVETVAAAPTPTRVYELRAVAQDRRVAMRLTQALSARGLTPRSPESDERSVTLVLLSNATGREFEPLYDTGFQPLTRVCVVLSGIDVPEHLATFHLHQWIDYRRRDDEALEGLARWLQKPTPENAKTLIGEPVALSRSILPGEASFLPGVLTFAAGLLIYATLFPVLETAYKDYDAPPGWGVVCGLAAALLGLTTAALVRARAVTFAMFVGLYLLTFALVVPKLASDDADGGAYFTLAVGVAISLFIGWRAQRSWLLSRRLPWRVPETLSPRPIARVVMRHIALTTLIASAAAVIWASSRALRGY
jgi:hypothetical protein